MSVLYASTKSTAAFNEAVRELQEKCLRANGWEYGMWRYYWVWRKTVHDASFICMNADEALAVEGCLQLSADTHPEPKP